MIAVLRWFVIVIAVVLVAALGRLGSLTFPGSRTVRARNAFLLRRGRVADFNWMPGNVPHDFRVGIGHAPEVIVSALRGAQIDRITRDRERALAIVGLLLRNAGSGGGIRADLATTYRGVQHGRGYCADYVRVYLAAAASVGLFCRRWAFSFDGYGSHGHTFVEIFDRDNARWMFIDVFNNVYAVKREDATPLDALGLRAALLGHPEGVKFLSASPARPGFVHQDKLIQYYVNGLREWCLWWGNDAVEQERGGLTQILLAFSGRIAYRLIIGLTRVPSLVAVDPERNEAELARMDVLRRRIQRAGSVVIASGVALLLGLAMLVFDQPGVATGFRRAEVFDSSGVVRNPSATSAGGSVRTRKATLPGLVHSLDWI